MKCPHCGKKLPVVHKRPSPKERAFAAHWLTNGNNGREAARSAGYRGTDGTLDTQAYRLLRRPQVQAILEQANLPTTELVMQVLREVGLTADESHARVAASRVLARIEGMIKPTEHRHLHAHLVQELPAVGSPERLEADVRGARAILRSLPPRERARLLREAEASDAVPELPVASVREPSRTEGGVGGVELPSRSEGPS